MDRDPTPDDVADAAERLDGVAVRTPLIEAPALSSRAGRRILVKAEPLQHTGSFKFRGAYNRLSRLDPATTPGGVVAYSSGNHAQGVAYAAQMLGLRAAIVMPADAPAAKTRRTRALGAEVVPYDRATGDRAAIAEALAAERGAVLVPPFDDPDVIAGQGTIGLEIAAQCARTGVRPEAVLVPCSGGGLSAGIALGLAPRLPGVALYTVEPRGWDDTARSLEAGRTVTVEDNPPSICDALLVRRPGELTLPILVAHGVRGLAVSDAEAEDAMRAAFAELKLVVEPGGAVALAAALAGLAPGSGPAVVVASGGNVDAARYAEVIAAS